MLNRVEDSPRAARRAARAARARHLEIGGVVAARHRRAHEQVRLALDAQRVFEECPGGHCADGLEEKPRYHFDYCHPAMLTVASTPKTREAVALGKCAMPTDVTLGWLTTAAYAGRELLTVNMAAFIDLYIWPFYGRFRPARCGESRCLGSRA